ncbi:MAG: DMT family transporter [Sutterellaceae bacterium]|nr:DMT family transporter [Sutterellaceae bacterium]
MSLQLRNSFLLLITATIWGSGFVAQALGMEHVSPFTFTWARSIIGGLFLLAVIPFLDTVRAKRDPQTVTGKSAWKNPLVWTGGIVCGTVLFISESLQQFGLLYTTVGKAGFLTSLYIVIVPILGIFVGRKTGFLVWISVVIAAIGLYFLCMPAGSFSLAIGDSLVLACALSFSFHILVIDRYAPLVDCVRMSCVQFFAGSLWGFILMMIFEPPTMEALQAALPAMLYAGIMSNGIAYTLQVIAQNGVHPTLASLIMSLESVVSVICGWLIMNQALSARELFGCVLMLGAIVLAQLPVQMVKRLLGIGKR